MTPYYEQDGIVIYHGDCREVLPTLDPVHHMITDPPYGIALSNHAKGRERSNRDFQIAGDADQAIGRHALAWASDRAMPIVTFANPLRPWPGVWRQALVWDKGPAVGGGGDTATLWKFTWELIQITAQRRRGARDSSVISCWVGPNDSPYHPAQKPETLIAYLLNAVTDAPDTILDPFIGSGTTLVAAKRLGRKAIGIELEEKYCEIAAKRLAQRALDFSEQPQRRCYTCDHIWDGEYPCPRCAGKTSSPDDEPDDQAEPEDDRPRRKLTRNEQLELAADAGYDTHDDFFERK